MSLLKETKKEGLRSPADVMKYLMGDKYTPFGDLDFWAQLGPDPTGAPQLASPLSGLPRAALIFQTGKPCGSHE